MHRMAQGDRQDFLELRTMKNVYLQTLVKDCNRAKGLTVDDFPNKSNLFGSGTWFRPAEVLLRVAKGTRRANVLRCTRHGGAMRVVAPAPEALEMCKTTELKMAVVTSAQEGWTNQR